MIPIRFSNLKRIAESPFHYDYYSRQPWGLPQKTHLRIGTAAHKYILGVGQQIVVYEGKVRRGKEYDAFEAAHPEALILNTREYERSKQIADRTLANPRVRELLARAPHREVKLNWEMAGKPCTGTVDAYGDDIVIEIKTAKTAALEPFWWQSKRFQYHAQLDWYRNALETVYGVEEKTLGFPTRDMRVHREAFIICVETSDVMPPPVVRPVTEGMLELGRKTWSSWFEQLCVCIDSDHFPGYTECDVPIDEPEEEVLTFGDDDEDEEDETEDE